MSEEDGSDDKNNDDVSDGDLDDVLVVIENSNGDAIASHAATDVFLVLLL